MIVELPRQYRAAQPVTQLLSPEQDFEAVDPHDEIDGVRTPASRWRTTRRLSTSPIVVHAGNPAAPQIFGYSELHPEEVRWRRWRDRAFPLVVWEASRSGYSG
jgi:hypothetical protein